ncbi:alanine--tRNA ligase [Desulfoluna spongiiphila]|uniref:alanine--tRNA ligase n=1 Tax=Desulfoluna spongiiphila TaxID=419481 RepID=UPI00125136D4|nr:alanine--tRNA ligase [Desulfoluna spongiiphila]VVS91110.1 alanine-trna ligase eukaryota/bacteria [Desulfoluna spongiiphila]
MKGSEARKLFIDYFKKHNHRNVRSSSLVPSDDPTLLFTNAGMVQFKRTFIGEEKREYTTAVTSQKCVRAGGKHNDLENVGYTARHHTFFEMLGNFSFGDYFKEQAITFAWDLLTNGYKLPVDKLWVSIYLDDDEAFEIWHKKIGVPEDRIVRLGEADNFWAMGDTGPCGPCTEIHIDRGERFGCDNPNCAVGCDCDRYLEIWNLVFMQYERDEEGTLTPLPNPCIDTGMGLERITSIMQNADTNYDTDLFTPIIGKVEELSGKKMTDCNDTAIAMKVIADHSRAASFLINDGVMPSNEGRGYVLRRIMRRAIRYGRFIGLTEPFLHTTSRVVMDMMADAYPELKESEAFITNVIRNEEESFSVTLDHGLKLLEEALEEVADSDTKVLSGEVIFRLYDTYGFPVDIIRDVISDESIVLDLEGFDKAMEAQREKSRSSVTFTRSGEAFRKLSAAGVKTEFTGYEGLTGESKILVVAVDGEEVDAPAAGTDVEVVVEATPFYGESGGQMGDCGTISGDGFQLTVLDTIKDPTGLFIHKCRVESGAVKAGLTATLAVDGEKRAATALNHSATHILHAALRSVLGDHVKQAGSLVGPDRLRFDFTHFAHVDRATLDAIEACVNDHIRMNVPVGVEEMDAEEAMKTGATALFDEKYGDRVRVVSMGDFSKEFCGGTHTAASGDIGAFRILSDSGIASGVRRIEALTGTSAVASIQSSVNTLGEAAAMVKATPENLSERLEKLLADNKALEKELKQLKMQMAGKAAESLDDDIKEVNGVRAVAKKVSVENPAQLRELADRFRDKIGSGVVLLGTESGGKALLLALVTKDLTKTYKAGDIVKKAAAIVGGGGGGRPDMAQAGGSKPEHLDEALSSLFEYLG